MMSSVCQSMLMPPSLKEGVAAVIYCDGNFKATTRNDSKEDDSVELQDLGPRFEDPSNRDNIKLFGKDFMPLPQLGVSMNK